jgi:preprotein translocase subunit YajC
MNNFWLIAQAGETQQTTTNQTAQVIAAEPVKPEEQTAVVVADGNTAPKAMPRQPQSQTMSLIFIVVTFVLLYLVVFRAPKKKEQQQHKLVQSLKKNDRVQTIGGIYGTVIDVKENEILLKIDESNNTKIKISPAAISRKLEDETVK